MQSKNGARTKVAMAVNNDEFYEMTNLFCNKKYELYKCNTIGEIINAIKDSGCQILVCDKQFDNLFISEVIELINENDLSAVTVLRYDCSENIDINYYLHIGVDDFVCERSSANLLIHRINTLLSILPIKNSSNVILKSDKEAVEMDLVKRESTVREEMVALTNYEFELLRFFLSNKNTILSREHIYSNVWQGKDFDDKKSRIIDTIIKNIRKKTNIRSIRSIRSRGYMWLED